MQFVEMKAVGKMKVPYLCGTELKDGERIKVQFEHYHHEIGEVLLDFACHGDIRPFLPVNFHGKKPWVYLVGMKAERL